VHGTPSGNERRLGNPASHGCIRMANRDVLQLAQMVMEADGGASVSPATVQTLIRNPAATREVSLAGRVRVRVIYRLTEVDSDSVTLHPDVYGRAARGYAARVRDELGAAGADPVAVLAGLDVNRSPEAALRVARQQDTLLARPTTVVVETVTLAEDSPLLPR